MGSNPISENTYYMPGYQNWNMEPVQSRWFAGPTPALGTTCCFANNPVDGFNASRVTTAREPRLGCACAPRIHEGDTYTYHFKKFSNRCRYGKPLATVNGSNSAGNKAIEIPHGESAPIGCSASYMGL